MTYGELYEALGKALKQHPEAREEKAYIAARKNDHGGYFDTDCEAVEVRVDAGGVIILSEGDQ